MVSDNRININRFNLLAWRNDEKCIAKIEDNETELKLSNPGTSHIFLSSGSTFLLKIQLILRSMFLRL